MQSPGANRFTVTISWLVVWLCVGALGWFLIDRHFKAAAGVLQASDAELKGLQQKYMTPSLREQDLRGAARDSAQRRRDEFQRALGGAGAAAFKDPKLDLRAALQQTAYACAPTNVAVLLDVDRFTEFTLTYNSPQGFSTNEMVEIARCVLPIAKPYLYALRFSSNATVLAELDRGDIDFIDDWSRATAERIAMLLPREVASDSAPDAETIALAKAITEDPGLGPKIQAAQTKFNDAIKEAFGHLNTALTLAEKATTIPDITDATRHAQLAKTFWMEPVKAWRALLAAQDISDAQIAVLPPPLRHDPARTVKVFEALEAKIESTRYYLNLTHDRPDIPDLDFNARVRGAEKQLRQDSQILESALHVWNDSLR